VAAEAIDADPKQSLASDRNRCCTGGGGPIKRHREAVTATVTLVNPAGLHFGPAVQFVQIAAGYPATIAISNLTTGAGPADAKRFNQVLGLGAEKGHTIEIRASGADAEATVSALVA
jgi:phosphotransferase system HPr (HPr) family protein